MIVTNLATPRASKCICMVLLFVHLHKVKLQWGGHAFHLHILSSYCSVDINEIWYLGTGCLFWELLGKCNLGLLQCNPCFVWSLDQTLKVFLKKAECMWRVCILQFGMNIFILLPNVLSNIFVDWPYKTSSHKLHQWSWCIQFLHSTIKNRNTWLTAGNIY